MYHLEISEIEKAKDRIQKAKERYEKELRKFDLFLPNITERSTILCKECGKRTQIKNVLFSRYYWYERPHGCMGGDTWHTKGFMVQCPKCGKHEHVHDMEESTKEYDIMVEMLRYAKQHGDVFYHDGKLNLTNEIEFRHS